ncbi:hypothetical protein COCNU_01G006530 [Cocos nucifera]|uniref:Uncharacterized protein n=1 Tax=Cocos nucifera TaxID=13894 RepID=A0A8K0HV44_COCNU|nr:hypothetical protein COCNU_01G006530 [Cocos nucifera]
MLSLTNSRISASGLGAQPPYKRGTKRILRYGIRDKHKQGEEKGECSLLFWLSSSFLFTLSKALANLSIGESCHNTAGEYGFSLQVLFGVADSGRRQL